MNTILIVLPILTLLMFDLGLTLQPQDFKLIAKHPKPVLIALFGQIVLLPLIAFTLAETFHLSPIFYLGIVLIACCPGGSSSNIFSMLAKGDVALSVSLTAFSSLITLITLPFIMELATVWSGANTAQNIHLPVGNLLMQNLLLMFLPIIIGVFIRRRWSKVAGRIEKVLSKLAFPALMLLAGIFFFQHFQTISDNIGTLGLCITLLILLAIGCAALLSRMAHVEVRIRRTIVIEVGMQNAAQAIAVASSPFIFNMSAIAIPSILYALIMNIVLLIYVGSIAYHKKNV